MQKEFFTFQTTDTLEFDDWLEENWRERGFEVVSISSSSAFNPNLADGKGAVVVTFTGTATRD